MVKNYVDNRRVARVVNEPFVRYLEYFVHRQSNKLALREEIFEIDLLLKKPKQLEKYWMDRVYSAEY